MIEFIQRTLTLAARGLAGADKHTSAKTSKRTYAERTFDAALESFVMGMQEQLIVDVWKALLLYIDTEANASTTEHEQQRSALMHSAKKLLDECQRLYFKQDDKDLELFKKKLHFLLNDLLTLHYHRLQPQP